MLALKTRQSSDRTESRSVAPLPGMLNSASVCAPSSVKLDPLGTPDLLNPMLLAPMINWLNPKSDLPAKTVPPAVTSGPAAATLTEPATRPKIDNRTPDETVLNYISQNVRKHGLLMTPQKLRDTVLDNSLAHYLNRGVIATVRSYAAESVLSPLRQEKSEAGLASAGNIAIWEDMVPILLSDDQDSDLFRSEMILGHGHVLSDAIIEQTLARLRLPLRLAAQNRALHDLRVLTSYLTHSQCHTLLNEAMTKDAETGSPQLHAENIGLLIESMKKTSPARERARRWRELECRKAELLLVRSRAYGRADNGVLQQVFFSKAVQRYCQLREKHRVIVLMTVLIQQKNLSKAQSQYAESVDFFTLAKQLCLTYPVDITSYANLLFIMDAACRKFSHLAQIKQWYQEMLTNYDQLLPGAFKAKLLYAQVLADADSAEPASVVVPRIAGAITQFNKTFSDMMTRQQPTHLQTRDLGRSEFLHCFASTFRLLARIAVDQLDKWDQMTVQQQVAFAALFIDNPAFSDHQLFIPDTHDSLRHSLPLVDALFERMVQNATSYLKRSINILIRAHSSEQERDLTEKLLVYHVNKLVGIYMKYDKVAELKQLLDKKNMADFMRYSGFDTQLPVWQKSLGAMQT